MPATSDGSDDGATAAEWAIGEARDWGVNVLSCYWASLGLFAVGLFHLFEQHAGWLYAQAQRSDRVDRSVLKAFEDWLTNVGVVVRDWPEWQKIVGELHHVANVMKHAEGNSAEKLRSIRPELFQWPLFRGKNEALFGGHPRKLHGQSPLAGEGIYVTEDDFKSYADAINAFWSNVAGGFDGVR